MGKVEREREYVYKSDSSFWAFKDDSRFVGSRHHTFGKEDFLRSEHLYSLLYIRILFDIRFTMYDFRILDLIFRFIYVSYTLLHFKFNFRLWTIYYYFFFFFFFENLPPSLQSSVLSPHSTNRIAYLINEIEYIKWIRSMIEYGIDQIMKHRESLGNRNLSLVLHIIRKGREILKVVNHDSKFCLWYE